MYQSPWETNRPSDSQEIPIFYKTRRFITAFTRALRLSLFWPRDFHCLRCTKGSFQVRGFVKIINIVKLLWWGVLSISPNSQVGLPPPTGCPRLLIQYICNYPSYLDTRWRSWLRHCTTSRKVAGSVPDGVMGIFHLHNPSGRTMTMRLTQSLTETSTSNISWRVKVTSA
jgi:hypothetical protein